MEEINIKDFLMFLKEKLFFIFISVLLCLGIVLAYDLVVKVPKYSTYTTIALVKSTNDSNTLTQNDVMLNKNLINTYSEIVKSKKVLKQVKKDLDLNESLNSISKEISVSSVNDTEIIKISVEDKDPKKAYNITKSISKVFTREIQNIYEMNNVSVVDAPEISKVVSNNTIKRDIVLGFAAGLFLSIGILFVIYYFDDTIKYSDNIEEELELPVLAKVFKSRIEDLNKKKKKSKKYTNTELILSKYPKSVVSESIKTLRTNLEFSSVEKTIRTMLITSSIPGEGKSFISSNLAISFAQANKRVLIIDSDMRKGRLHKIFKLSNTKGYSDLLIDKIENFDEYIKKTSIPGVSVITRGTIPPNPSELLNSTKNKDLIKELKRHYDKIIFDGVPCSGLPDSIIMSSLVDKVLIVSSNGYTPKSEFMSTKNSLEKANAPIAGFIVNKIDSTQGTYGKYYYYYGDRK
ncbi:MAG: polysaccharide biosynthesis tyrosine autokinase [Bacilli bacterium]|nr:polysaccharide biosynthesis tyrosine autokinase [Bacilli bacterium]